MVKLKRDAAHIRVYAMGTLVGPWISHRIEETRKRVAEKMAMREHVTDFAIKGAEFLKEHRADDELYLEGDFYGSCQACEAAMDLGKLGW